MPSSVNLATNETVTKINFEEQLISKLIVALNPNKAHGHDGLSIRMFQIVSDSLNPSQPELSESRLLPDSMEEGQRCPCPQKKETNKIWIIIELLPS